MKYIVGETKMGLPRQIFAIKEPQIKHVVVKRCFNKKHVTFYKTIQSFFIDQYNRNLNSYYHH
jgi:hypothetical protein